MSLINDALKRATQNPAPSASATAPEPQTPMQPVEYRHSVLPWYFFPGLLIVLAGACWFLVRGFQSSGLPGGTLTVHAREPQPDPASSTDSQPSSEMLAAGIIPPADDAAYTPTRLPNRNFSLDDAPAATTAPTTPETTPVVAPAPAVVPKPAYRLQGIFFFASNPSATVNGKNVSVGSRINGATVTAITRDGVTLEADGQITVLTLE